MHCKVFQKQTEIVNLHSPTDLSLTRLTSWGGGVRLTSLRVFYKVLCGSAPRSNPFLYTILTESNRLQFHPFLGSSPFKRASMRGTFRGTTGSFHEQRLVVEPSNMPNESFSYFSPWFCPVVNFMYNFNFNIVVGTVSQTDGLICWLPEIFLIAFKIAGPRLCSWLITYRKLGQDANS